ncbi:hypothetical protein [Paraburkholderia sp. Cpub6]|uniref:hypothetical protein n=1 Tax=Paraburkholderia sp. Cpub6 TaxID=2723094 RepID=UPI00161CBCBF|nr:hypothetical protein [Paraburkholderia sp. Cpub6]MBB5456777.1 hypothetical protein [Paraburkholderia sp. Cpub6]
MNKRPWFRQEGFVPLGALSDFMPMTRRTFIVGSLASPALAANNKNAAKAPWSDPDDLTGLRFSEDSAGIAIIRPPSNKRLTKGPLPADDPHFTGQSWRIDRMALGPEATFRLKIVPTGTNKPDDYVLEASHVRLGNLGNAWHQFHFHKINDTWRVQMVTNIWTGGKTSSLSLKSDYQDFDKLAELSRARLDAVCEEPTALSDCKQAPISAPFVFSCDGRLVHHAVEQIFEGHLILRDPVTLGFHPGGVWYLFSGTRGALIANTLDARLHLVVCAWCRQMTPPTSDGAHSDTESYAASVKSAKASKTDRSGKKSSSVKSADEADSGEHDPVFYASAVVDTDPKPHTMTRGTSPSMSITSTDCVTWRYTRRTWRNQPNAWKAGIARLASSWRLTLLSHGNILLDGLATHDAALEAWRAEGDVLEMGFTGEFVSDEQTVHSPMGRIRVRGARDNAAPRPSVLILARGPAGAGASRMTIASIALDFLLLAADLALADAEYSELRFAPTELRAIYHQNADKAKESVGTSQSYLWLDAQVDPEPLPLARIDLSNARLQVGRARDLMSLSFLFAGLRLDVFKGHALLVDTSAECAVVLRADPDDRQDGQHSLESDLRDTRPVLVAEFPPQHVFEECVFRPNPPAFPDVLLEQPTIKIPRKDLSSDRDVGKDDMLTVITEGQAFANYISTFPMQDRVVMRRALKNAKLEQEKSAGQSIPSKISFADFAAAFENGRAPSDMAPSASGTPAAAVPASSAHGPVAIADAPPTAPRACAVHDCVRHANLPADQCIYIGPFGMDPDAAAWARRLNLCVQASAIKVRVIDMLKLADNLIKGLRIGKQPSPPNSQGIVDQLSSFLEYAWNWIKGNKESSPPAVQTDTDKTRWFERVAEATIPSYQDFREFYRLEMTRLYFDAEYRRIYADGIRYDPKSGDGWKPEDVPTNTSAAQIEYISASGVTTDVDRAAARRESVIDRYVDAATQRTELPARARARLANPSRLAFLMDCAPPRNARIDQTRDVRHWFESPLPVEPTSRSRPFLLSTLMDWSNFRMSVCPRAMEIPHFNEAGLLVREGEISANTALDRTKKKGDKVQDDAAQAADTAKEATDQSNAAVDMLRMLHMRSGSALTAAERVADVEAALKIAPTPLQTAIELPARLILSPSQSAVWRTPESKLDWAPGPYHSPPNQVLHKAQPLWTAELLAIYPNPGLRAVFSPDLRPGFVHGNLIGAPDQGSAAAAASDAKAPPMHLHTPANLAPPRGPRAPWTLGIEDADIETSSMALLRRASGATDGVECPPEQAPDTDAPASNASAVDPASAPDNVTAYPLLDYLCRRKAEKQNGYGADGVFRTSLDAYDRHELVVLSSAWGLPVRGRREQNGQLQQSQVSSQVELPSRWRPIDIEGSSATYLPRALQLQELRLSALGGTLRHETDFVPPASARHIAYGPLFDSLSIERWQHWTVLGRDVHAEVVYKGFLFPIGHRASLVKQTERVFLRRKDCERVRAWLRQRMFIRISKPDKLFPARGHPNAGRQFPPKLVQMLTQTTPDIVDPTEDSTNPVTDFPSPAGRLFVDEPGLVFWPRTARIEGTDVLFDMMFDTAVTQAPLIFVDNVAANRDRLLANLIDYYNNYNNGTSKRRRALPIGIASPDDVDLSNGRAQIDLQPIDPGVHLRTLDFGGQTLRYCDETKPGGSSHKTISWTLKAAGGVASVPSRNDPNTNDFEGNNSSFDDPSLAAADQPPFYPMMETARIRLDQIERIVNGGQQVVLVQFDGYYVANGFPSTAPRDASGVSTPDVADGLGTHPYRDTREVYLDILNIALLSAGTSGDRTGAVMHPQLPLAGLSRTCGPLGGERGQSAHGMRKAGTLFSIVKNYTIPGNGLPAGGHALALPPSIVRVVADPRLAAGAANGDDARNAMKQVFSNFFSDHDTTLLGVVKLSELASYLLADATSEYLPKLRDTVDYALAGMQATSDSINALVVGPLREIVRVQRQKWLDVATKLKVPGSQGTPLDINVQDVFPDIDSALADLQAALIVANDAGNAGQSARMSSELAVVYGCGRRLIDAIARVMANPLDRVMVQLEQKLAGFQKQLENKLFEKIGNREQLKPISDWLESVSQTPPPDSADFIQLLPLWMPPLNDARTGFLGINRDKPDPDEANKALAKARDALSNYPGRARARLVTAFRNTPPKSAAVLANECWLGMLKDAGDTLTEALAQLKSDKTGNPVILAATRILSRERDLVATLTDNAKMKSIPTGDWRTAALSRLFALLQAADIVRDIRGGRLDPFQGVARFTVVVLPQFLPVDQLAFPSLKDAAGNIAERLNNLSSGLTTWRNESGGKFALSEDHCSQCNDVHGQPDVTGDSVGILDNTFRELLKKLQAKLAEVSASPKLAKLPDLKQKVDTAQQSINSLVCNLDCALRLWSFGLDQIAGIDWMAPLRVSSEAQAVASLQLEPISVTVSHAASAMKTVVDSAYRAIGELVALPAEGARELLDKALLDAARDLLGKAFSLLTKVNDWICDNAEQLIDTAGLNADKAVKIQSIKAANDAVINAASNTLHACKTLDDLANNSLQLQLSTSPFGDPADRAAAQVAIALLPTRLIEHMTFYRDQVLASASEIVQQFSSKLAFMLFSEKTIGGEPAQTNIPSIYKSIYVDRNDVWRKLSTSSLAIEANGLLVAPDEPPNYYSPPVDTGPTAYAQNETTDQLARDVISLNNLQAVLNPAAPLPDPAFRYVVRFLQGWQNGAATPLRITQQIRSVSIEALRSQLLAIFDFGAMRDAIETQIKLLVPSRMTTSLEFSAKISPDAAGVTGNIFKPLDNCALNVASTTIIDLLASTGPQISCVGELGAFDIALVGDLVEAVTLHFAGAQFRTTGGSPTCDLHYAGFSIGRELDFLQSLAPYFGGAKGTGFYLNPFGLGLEVGYGLNLGIISIGTVSFFNVSINAAARLRFDDQKATFVASLARRDAPFTISVAPYGGSGFFALEASGDGIVGFEASFEYGGAAAFAYGPLTGYGRIMTGIYIRSGRDTPVDFAATFYCGGAASIWIFTFGASLSVLAHQSPDGKRMEGTATFRFSFSMGFVSYDYSVNVSCSINWGGGGATTKSDGGKTSSVHLDDPVRLASISIPFDDPDVIVSDVPVPLMPAGSGHAEGSRVATRHVVKNGTTPATQRSTRMRIATVCESQNWAKYQTYFDDHLRRGVDF